MGIGQAHADRYLILDIGDGAIVAIILHTIAPASLDEFAAEAMPIVESLRFR